MVSFGRETQVFISFITILYYYYATKIANLKIISSQRHKLIMCDDGEVTPNKFV